MDGVGNSELSTAYTQNSEFIAEFQSNNLSYVASNRKNAEHWGENGKFIIFPEILPNFYLPTRSDYLASLEGKGGLIERAIAAIVAKRRWQVVTALIVLFLAFSLYDETKNLLSSIWEVTGENAAVTIIGVVAFLSFFKSLVPKIPVLGLILAYQSSWKEWSKSESTDAGWRKKNRDEVWNPWVNAYRQYLKSRKMDVELAKAMTELSHIFSQTRHKVELPNGRHIVTTLIAHGIKGEPTMELAKTVSTHVSEAERWLKEHSYLVADALTSLTDEERELHATFHQRSGEVFSETLNESPESESSVVKYEKDLKKELLKRTNLITSEEVKESWRDLLMNMNLSKRKLDSQEHGERTVEELLSSIQSSSENVTYSIISPSGRGKTTTILQTAIGLLKSHNNGFLPLVIKARSLTVEPNETGELFFSNVIDQGYLRRWEQSEKRLLILDGIDENIKLRNKLCQMLHRVAEHYASNVLITSRPNTIPSQIPYFKLRNFDNDYQLQLIYASSSSPKLRSYLAKVMPEEIRENALTVFGSSELLANSYDNEAMPNISANAISEWLFKRATIDTSSVKYYNLGELNWVNLALAMGEFALEEVLETPLPKRRASNLPGYQKARELQLFDEDAGVYEPLLEPYCMFHVIGENESEKVKKIFTRLMHDKDYDKLQTFISTYLTHENSLLPPLMPLFDENSKDRFVEIREDILYYAMREWLRSDIEVRQRILHRLDIPSDNDGRISLSDLNSLHLRFHQPNLLSGLLTLHCESWSGDNYPKWITKDDTTWLTLSKSFFELQCSLATERAKQFAGTIHKKGFDIFEKMHAEDVEILYKNDKQLRHVKNIIEYMLLPLVVECGDECDKFDYRPMKVADDDDVETEHNIRSFLHLLSPSKTPDMVWFYPIKLLPRNPTNSYTTSGHLNAGKSLISLFEYLFDLNTDSVIVEKIYVYLLLIRISEGNTAFGMQYNKRMFEVFRRKYTELQTEADKCLLEKSYHILRRAKYDTRMTSCFAENPVRRSLRSINSHGNQTVVADLTGLYVKTQREETTMHQYERYNQLKMVYPPIIGWDDNNELQSKLVYLRLTDKAGKMPFNRTLSEDNVSQTAIVQSSRLYSAIPLEHLPGANHNVAVWPTIVGKDPESAGTDEAPFAVPLLFHEMPLLMRELLLSDGGTNNSTFLEFQDNLRRYGVVTDINDVDDLGYSNLEGKRLVGVFTTQRGPDYSGRIWYSVIGKQSGNNCYLIPEMGEPFSILHDVYQKHGKHKIAWFEFEVDVFENPSNKHLLAQPKNIQFLCNSCLKHISREDIDLNHICEVCWEDMTKEDSVKTHLSAILKVNPACILIHSDLAECSWTPAIGRIPSEDEIRSRAEAARKILSFYFPGNANSWSVECILPKAL